jgi:protein-S-isoprenylcysteine O-methyltransferase Ste14
VSTNGPDGPDGPTPDPQDLFASQQEVQELEQKSATAARLFDIRRIIGGLFVVYGVIVTIMGISPPDHELEKAEDVNINLWTGLAMLVFGILMLLWQWLRPVVPPSAEELAAAAERPDVE